MHDRVTQERNFRIRYSSPSTSAATDIRIYLCGYCHCRLDMTPQEIRVCRSRTCIELAIDDRTITIQGLVMSIAKVRLRLDREKQSLLDEIANAKNSAASPLLVQQYESILKSLVNGNRFNAINNRDNQIQKLKNEIRELATSVKRPNFTRDFRKFIWERDDKNCYLCHKKIDSWTGTNMHIDHVNPRSAGGSDKPSNLRASHPSCNLKKSDRPLSSRKLKAALKQLRKSSEDEREDLLF